MSPIQTMWQVPTEETPRRRDRDGESLDVRWMLDAPVCEEKPVPKSYYGKGLRLAITNSVRIALRGVPEGMTLEEISELMDRPKENVRKVLKAMPDVYIDRWEAAQRGQYKAVWCIVVPPANCPRPDGASYDEYA
jgi:hypothetical protein